MVTRWVIYNPKHGVDYDASMVPATWYAGGNNLTKPKCKKKLKSLKIMMTFKVRMASLQDR